MGISRAVRLAAAPIVLAGAGIVGMVWGLSAAASPITAAPASNSAHVGLASTAADNLSRLVVGGVAASVERCFHQRPAQVLWAGVGQVAAAVGGA